MFDNGVNAVAETEKEWKRHVHGRKAVKLSKTQERLLGDALPKVEIPFGEELINHAHFFETDGPLHLEIGFGNGEYTLGLAETYPSHRIIACEIFKNGIATILKGLEATDHDNIRIINGDAIAAVEDMFAADTFDFIHINHPDPWHKKRHFKRRLIQTHTVELFEKVLKTDGEIWLCTDAYEYYDWMLECFAQSVQLERLPTDGRLIDDKNSQKVMTRYERRGIAQGRPPKYLRYKKVAIQ